MKEGVLAETDQPQDLRKSEVPALAQAAQQMARGERGMMPVEVYGGK